MKLGVLLADELRPALTSRFGDYAKMFFRFFAGRGMEFAVYDVRAGEYPAQIADCDGYLITGSRHGVYEELPWLAALLDFIRRLRERRAPLIGVCFGHQAVAQALGGKAEKSDKGWGLGLQQWQTRELAAWMRPPLSALRLLSSHQDQVSALPPGATLLAGNDFCPFAAFSVDSHIFCVQGHPEFTADFMLTLLEYREEDAPAETVRRAAASAVLPTDSAVVADWMEAFLRQDGRAAARQA